MRTRRKVTFLTTTLLLSVLSIWLIQSCKISQVGPIDPYVPIIPVPAATLVSGIVWDDATNAGLQGVSITVGGLSATTNATGIYLIEQRLPAGTYTLKATLANYVDVSKTLIVSADTTSTYDIDIAMAEKATPVTVDAAAGGTVTADDGGTVEIPAGALTETIQITVTPIITSTGVAQAEIPAQTPTEAISYAYSLEPHGTTFSQPVTITVPLGDIPPDEITSGQVKAVKLDIINNIWETLAPPTLSGDQQGMSVQVTSFSELYFLTQDHYTAEIIDVDIYNPDTEIIECTENNITKTAQCGAVRPSGYISWSTHPVPSDQGKYFALAVAQALIAEWTSGSSSMFAGIDFKAAPFYVIADDGAIVSKPQEQCAFRGAEISHTKGNPTGTSNYSVELAADYAINITIVVWYKKGTADERYIGTFSGLPLRSGSVYEWYGTCELPPPDHQGGSPF